MAVVLLVLFIAVPIAELSLLLAVGRIWGPGPTLLLILVTAILGAALARWQGVKTLRRIREELHAGRMPATELFEGALILVAGAFLLTPGLITDAAGLLLLLPPFRTLLTAGARKWAAPRVRVVAPEGGVRDAEVHAVRDADKSD